MELRHLRYFVAVASYGSFSQAAAVLRLTQPTVSRQVQDLEDELGVLLVKRTANAVTLTKAGEDFYEEAREILSQVDQSVERVRGGQQDRALRIGYVPSLAVGVMPRAIERFQTEHPRIRLELSDLAPAEINRRAANKQIDLAITIGACATVEEFAWREMSRISIVLILSPRHPLAKRKTVDPKALQSVTLIPLDRVAYPEYIPHLRKMLAAFGVKPRFSAHSADGILALFTAVEAGNGATLLLETTASLMPCSLVFRQFRPALKPVTVHVGYSAVKASSHAQAFADILFEETRKLKERTPTPT
ncbi:MAG: LysR family transcriptional regulator [Verrucomicrobiota bacterium]